MVRSHQHPHVLDPSDTVLMVIDVQERFRPVMEGFDRMVAGCVRLVRAFRKLELPVIVTEQYPSGLGPTVEELKSVLGAFQPLEKTAFSSYRCPGVPDQVAKVDARAVLVCGIETHVCVNQTVHDLLAAGYSTHVAVDAVESRHTIDRETALRKMASSGAILTTAEMATFELLFDARHEKFRKVQALFK